MIVVSEAESHSERLKEEVIMSTDVNEEVKHEDQQLQFQEGILFV